MKKLSVVLALGLLCATTLTLKADDTAPADKKAARKALIEKYDTDKNGKLSKDEIAKMTPEDKAAWDKLGTGHKKKTDGSTNSVPDATK
jgi:hypothetical protein